MLARIETRLCLNKWADFRMIMKLGRSKHILMHTWARKPVKRRHVQEIRHEQERRLQIYVSWISKGWFQKKIQCYIFYLRRTSFNVTFYPNSFCCWIPENEDAIIGAFSVTCSFCSAIEVIARSEIWSVTRLSCPECIQTELGNFEKVSVQEKLCKNYVTTFKKYINKCM